MTKTGRMIAKLMSRLEVGNTLGDGLMGIVPPAGYHQFHLLPPLPDPLLLGGPQRRPGIHQGNYNLEVTITAPWKA